MTRLEQHKKRKRENKGNYSYYNGSIIISELLPYVHSLPILSTNVVENWLGTIGNIYDFTCARSERHLIIESD
jgi:hypothetical protein